MKSPACSCAVSSEADFKQMGAISPLPSTLLDDFIEVPLLRDFSEEAPRSMPESGRRRAEARPCFPALS